MTMPNRPDSPDRRKACKRMTSLLLAASLPAAATTVRLHPPSGRTEADTRAAGDFDWARLQAGDVVELTQGEYGGDVVLRARGTEERPVILRAAAGQKVVIRGSLTIDGASWVRVQGFNFVGASGIAVALRGGARYVSVSDNVIENCGLGIWIGGAAGGSHCIESNTVKGNRTHGIAIDRVNLAPDDVTLIRGNRVSDNGHHGIEVNGSRYVIEHNEVFRNGRTLPGTSGIHCYAKDEREGTGCHNVIRYNVTWGQRDKAGPDGNGIQLDRWCDHNEVLGNLAFDNDGAGINLFHAAHNRVVGNTLHRNMRDVARSHLPRLKGELVITNDVDMTARVTDIEVADNVIVARYPGVAAVVLDDRSRQVVTLLANTFFHEGKGALLRIGERETTSLAELQKAVTSVRDNRAVPPVFFTTEPRTPAQFGMSMPGAPK